jgi:ethanolamine utilization protein EutA
MKISGLSMSYPNVKIDFEQFKKNMYFIVGKIVQTVSPLDHEQKLNSFISTYEATINKLLPDATTDYIKLRLFISQFIPVLNTIYKPGEEFDKICEWILATFEPMLGNAYRQVTGELQTLTSSAILPSNLVEPELNFFCPICKEEFPIPADTKEAIFTSSDTIDLPEHHDTQMQIKIKKIPVTKEKMKIRVVNKLDFSAEFLMGYLRSENSHAEYLKVLSVGIDIGSSTSHLIFSKLTLKREIGFFNISNRFILINRDIIYESEIINTPLQDSKTIDINAVFSFIEKEYSKAGIKKEDVDTGAVIVTGETAKKTNASEIAKRVSSETGKFVSATAGPNFESVLGIMGSGVLDKSRNEHFSVINIDIGGGTSNLALASNGIINSTACINVGGRLLGIYNNNEIWRLDDPTRKIFEILGLEYEIGDIIKEEDLDKLVTIFSGALLEVMQGPAKSNIAKLLMMTENLDFSIPVDYYSFSGGVAEFIYSERKNILQIQDFQDIGIRLAKKINESLIKLNFKIIEPENKIRATVIGAGAFSLSVSGSTCYVDKNIRLPINNVPVVLVDLNKERFSLENTALSIKNAISNYDLVENDIFALYFEEPIYQSDKYLVDFAKGIENSLENKIKGKQSIILLFKMDMAKILSVVLRNETKLQKNLIILDELTFETGDWIDIGAPLSTGDVYPVTIKSLVFKSA